MEAFLDRRWQGWRDRASDRAKTERKSPRGGGMTANEAYDVLGLTSGAKPDEIRAAHRRLMMKFHPDQGGSTYLAARINQAKEILLRNSHFPQFEAHLTVESGTFATPLRGSVWSKLPQFSRQSMWTYAGLRGGLP